MAEQKMTLISSDFSEGESISATYTCDGMNISPPLKWIHPPAGTRSYALIVDDPDAPNGTFTHWVLFDIPAGIQEFPERESAGTAGRNDFQGVGYGGPCPPPRHGKHRYNFTLYALDVESLKLPEGASRQEVEQAMQGHILHQTQLTGLYERR